MWCEDGIRAPATRLPCQSQRLGAWPAQARAQHAAAACTHTRHVHPPGASPALPAWPAPGPGAARCAPPPPRSPSPLPRAPALAHGGSSCQRQARPALYAVIQQEQALLQQGLYSPSQPSRPPAPPLQRAPLVPPPQLPPAPALPLAHARPPDPASPHPALADACGCGFCRGGRGRGRAGMVALTAWAAAARALVTWCAERCPGGKVAHLCRRCFLRGVRDWERERERDLDREYERRRLHTEQAAAAQ